MAEEATEAAEGKCKRGQKVALDLNLAQTWAQDQSELQQPPALSTLRFT